MKKLIITPLGTVAPYCMNNKNCPGFFIEYGEEKILFDCGNGVTSLMNLQEDMKNLNIFISHLHPDHYGDLISIMQTAKVYKQLGYLNNNINIYIPSTIIEVDEKGHDKDGWGITRKVRKPVIDYDYIYSYEKDSPVNIIDYDEIDIQYKDFKITSLEVSHDIEAYAFRIDTQSGSVVYSGDTGTDNNLRIFAEGVDLFICEATYLKGQLRKSNVHLYAYEAAEIAKDANVDKLLLTHFWPNIDKKKYLKEAKEIFENTEVAEEGKKLVLKK